MEKPVRKVTKKISASDILKRKGVEPGEMDMSGFNEVVENFFMTHEVKDTIVLVPKRFVEMEVGGDPELMNEEELADYNARKEELKSQKKAGWIDRTDISIWQKRVDDPDDSFTLFDYVIAKNRGLIRPMICVDEPFIGNAAAYLRDFCGFIVKKQRGGRWIVSLPV